ncbi:MAG: beta-L-arabinofuranosidase domain-containing protein [Brevinema sp.]
MEKAIKNPPIIEESELKIRPLIFKHLLPTEVRPLGWLKDQLEIQEKGLSGHLDLFWPDVKDSGWFGGDAEGWERGPYWLDGAIPMAFLTENKALQNRIENYVNYIITHQDLDGWLGCKGMKTESYSGTADDVWSQFLGMKILIAWHEATGDIRVVSTIEKCLVGLYNKVSAFETLFNWSHIRWFEAFIAIFWYEEQTKDTKFHDLAIKLKAQGFNWDFFVTYFPYKSGTPYRTWNYMSHIVNAMLALKSGALSWRLFDLPEDRALPEKMLNTFDKYHGTAVGIITGDECFAGTSPNQGTELCGVVDMMYSLEHIIEIFGESSWVDRLEQVCFNALPATFTGDMWAHQYDQQVNQIECSEKREWPWTTNNADANIFGLEPHYGCCTANFSQGWPKFIQSAIMKHEKGIVILSYVPVKTQTYYKGKRIEIQTEGSYPFQDSAKIKIVTNECGDFILKLRIPKWSTKTIFTTNTGLVKEFNQITGFYEIVVTKDIHDIFVSFEFPIIRHVRLENKSCYFTRGALTFSLPIKENFIHIHQDIPGRELPHADWELHADQPWNYTVLHNDFNIEFLGEGFSKQYPTIILKGKAVEVKNWINKNGCAVIDGVVPILDHVEHLINLVPYGTTNLRITEFPLSEDL